MENITSFLENKINEQSMDEYVVAICDMGRNGSHDYSVENFWGPLQGGWEEEDKLKKVLGYHNGDEDNMTCNVKTVNGDELIDMIKKYNHNNTTESTLKAQGSRYALGSFLSMFED